MLIKNRTLSSPSHILEKTPLVPDLNNASVTFAVIGNDRRQTFLQRLLEERGYVVYPCVSYDEACLRGVCETATKWLESFDLTGIE